MLWRGDCCRVVLAADPYYPAFCRVILNRHVKEMTDLDENERSRLMTVVFVVEAALRELLRPDKINLASLGNITPHVHWHVIPRFAADRHFPNPVWGAAKHDAAALPLAAAQLQSLRERLAEKLKRQPETIFERGQP